MRLETKKYLYDIDRAVALLIQFTANKTFPHPPTSFPQRRESPTRHPRMDQPPAHETTHPRHSREGGNLQQDARAWNDGLPRLASG